MKYYELSLAGII